MFYNGSRIEIMQKEDLIKGLSELLLKNDQLKESDKFYVMRMAMTYDLDDLLLYLNNRMYPVHTVSGLCYDFVVDNCVSDDHRAVMAKPVVWDKPAVRVGYECYDHEKYRVYASTYMDIRGNVFCVNEHFWSERKSDIDLTSDDLDSFTLFSKWVTRKLGIDLSADLSLDDCGSELTIDDLVISGSEDEIVKNVKPEVETSGISRPDDWISILVVRVLADHGLYRFNALPEIQDRVSRRYGF